MVQYARCRPTSTGNADPKLTAATNAGAVLDRPTLIALARGE
jgi:hypothetical protein